MRKNRHRYRFAFIWFVFSLIGVPVLSVLPVLPAQALPALLMEVGSGKIYYAHEVGRPWHPASLTKMMTAYVTFNAIKQGRITLQTAVRMSKAAGSVPPSKMGFKTGTVMTIDNALYMLLVKSANDIGNAIAESVGGTRRNFVREMNETAQKLGMTGTYFVNPHGLHNAKQVTTARDMAILARAITLQFPDSEHYFQTAYIRHGKKKLRSYNMLLTRYRGTTGMKTGFVCASGYNLAARIRRNGKQYIAVILGAYSSTERSEIAAALFDRVLYNKRTLPRPVSLSSLRNERGQVPPNMRERVCTTKKKKYRKIRAQEIAKIRVNANQSHLLATPFLPVPIKKVHTGIVQDMLPSTQQRHIPFPRPNPLYTW